MEEVIEKMTMAVVTPESKSVQSGFSCLYKNYGRLSKQDERRKELLENQKNERKNKMDKLRGILELVNAVEDNNIFEKHKKTHYRPSIYVAGFNRAPFSYNNILMLSEWMIERPFDFPEYWLVSPCPKGARMLVIATQGKTKCFSKYGQLKFITNTLLPGGNPHDRRNHKQNCCCILDCFYDESSNTMYVIDLLAWNNQPMTDCDTEFRNYWLQSKFTENPGLGEITKMNKMKVVLLPKVPCTAEKFNEFMMTWPPFANSCVKAEGLLFYHKEAHYVSGETPLVGWLYPYMVPEVLGAEITVHPAFLQEKPEDYIDQATFITAFEQKRQAKIKASRNKPWRFGRYNKMDTSDLNSDEEKTAETEIQPHTMEAEEIADKTTNVAEADEVSVKRTDVEKVDIEEIEVSSEINGQAEKEMEEVTEKTTNDGSEEASIDG